MGPLLANLKYYYRPRQSAFWYGVVVALLPVWCLLAPPAVRRLVVLVRWGRRRIGDGPVVENLKLFYQLLGRLFVFRITNDRAGYLAVALLFVQALVCLGALALLRFPHFHCPVLALSALNGVCYVGWVNYVCQRCDLAQQAKKH